MNDPAPLALIVEDEPQIRRFVHAALAEAGWRVHEAAAMKPGLVDAGTRRPDLVILDLGLPDGDGVDFIRDLRTWSGVPVIVLSARVEEDAKVRALDAGANDYLTKPFGVAELLARVRVAMRHRQVEGEVASTRFTFGTVAIDLAARTVKKAGAPVHLTPIEYRLLGQLIAGAGKLLTHRQLLREVWGPSHVDDTHYLRVHMGNLRLKLEDDPAQPRYLLTETGVGYRLLA